MLKRGTINKGQQAGRKTLLIFLLTLLSFTGFAQFYNGSNVTFGKNRVQYRDFLWTYYKFPDFDVYFYRNGRPLANFVSEYAANQLTELENKMGISLDKKIRFVIFNTLNDMKQTNIGLVHDGESVEEGGLNTVLQYKALLYFDGDLVDFEKEIRKGIAGILYNQMSAGTQSFTRQMLTSSSKVDVPRWFEKGYISFVTESWNTTFDNYLRDGVLSGAYKDIDDLEKQDAVIAGHAFWHYIAVKYGRVTVNNIVRMTSLAGNLNKGFRNVIGLKYKEVRKNWWQYYQKYFQPYANKAGVPSHALPIKCKNMVRLLQPLPDPAGRQMAYVSNLSGKYRIMLYDYRTKKSHKIFQRGAVVETPVDYRYPLLAWHPSGQVLAFALEEKGHPWLFLYDVHKKKITKLLLTDVQKILSMSYSSDGRFIVMSAIQNGSSDLFVYHVAAHAFEKITNDRAADMHPVFINHDKQILFSSNRLGDTLNMKPSPLDTSFTHHYDLFLYDFVHHSNVLKRLTQTPLADETQPEPYGQKSFRYLSDANGIRNAWLGIVDSTVQAVDTTVHYRYFIHTKPVTDYSRNIVEQHVDLYSGKLADLMLVNNRWKIYLRNIVPFAELPQKKLQNTPFMAYRIKTFLPVLQVSPKENKPQVLAKAETQKPGRLRKHFRMLYLDKNGKEVVAGGAGGKGKSLYGAVAGEIPGNMGYYDAYGHFIFPKRRNYYTEYALNGMVTQFNYNYLTTFYQPYTRGVPYNNTPINLGYKFGISDLMEDHRIIGGFRLNTSFIDNEYTFSYANYKHRLNREILFHRNTITQSTRYYLGKVHTHELYYILTWPFNENLSLHGTAHFRDDMYVLNATDQYSLNYPTTFENWLGFTAALVYDGTKRLALNLYTGSRWKIFFEYNQLLAKGNHNLFVAGFDYRYYHRIYRNFIVAARLAGSSGGGTDRLIYFMGGVDNWLNPKYNTTTPVDPNQHWAYRAQAVSMRGFPENIRNGNSFLLLNTELRMPVFQMFSATPISSKFFKNFQLVTFGDVGTAWTGPTPYSEGNALFIKTVNSGPIHAVVETQRNPIVEGFGFGFRINLLGYFLRTDIAWGVQDGRVAHKPLWHWSFNLDF